MRKILLILLLLVPTLARAQEPLKPLDASDPRFARVVTIRKDSLSLEEAPSPRDRLLADLSFRSALRP